MKYVALLRGINVGGNNIIKMLSLKECFEQMGFTEVRTYIQSGNVIFNSAEVSLEKLTEKIEKILSKTFSYQSTVVVVPHKLFEQVIQKAPPKFGKEPLKYRYDVLFLKSPLKASEAMKEIKVREEVDQVFVGPEGVLYFSRLISQVAKSYVSKIVMLPIYKKLTIRNWNTTEKIANL